MAGAPAPVHCGNCASHDGACCARIARNEARVTAVECDERVQERVVRFVRQLPVEALAAAHADRTRGVGGPNERVAERGLPGPVFTREQDEPARRRAHGIEGIRERRQLRPAVDEHRRTRCARRIGSDRGARLRYVGNERIATAGGGLDERAVPGLVAERLADLAHEHLDVLRLDVRIRPDGRHDRGLGHPRAGLLQQTPQERRGLAGERNLFRAAPERAVLYVESESRKMLRHVSPHCRVSL